MTDAIKRDTKGISIWWSREHRCWIASAQVIPGVIGVGQDFVEAATALKTALAIHMPDDAPPATAP